MSRKEALPIFVTCAPGGGAATYAEVVAKALAGSGWPVAILVAGGRSTGRQRDDINGVLRLTGPAGNLHYYLRKLVPPLSPVIGIVRGMEIARLFSKTARSLGYSGGAVMDTFEGVNFGSADRRRWPICVSLHSSSFIWKLNLGEMLTSQDRLDMRAERSQLLSATRVRSASRTVAEQLQTLLGATLDQLDVFPYLVDERLFRSDAAEPPGGAGLNILHVGRPDSRKGAQHLLSAIPMILCDAPHCTFRFVGWSEGDTVAQAMLKGRLSQSQRSAVRLLGRLSYEELLREYDQAHVCVVPSEWDCSPFSVYEPMARACAVVASAVGGIPELLTDGDSGLLVPPRDPESLATALTSLASDPDRLMHLRRRSRERALHLFNPTQILERQMDYYRAAWESHGRA